MKKLGLAVGVLAMLAAGVGRAAEAPGSFTHLIRLAIDGEKLEGRRPDKQDEKRLQEALKKRLPMLGSKDGQVEIAGLGDIRVRVPVELVDASQLHMLCMPGQLELRDLDEVQTSFNPHGKYLLDFLTTPNQSLIRFKERDSGRVLPPEKFVPKCPLVLGPDDVSRGSSHAVRDGALTFVRVEFDKSGSDRLEHFVRKPGRLLAVVLDGEILSINAVTRKARKARRGDKGGEGKAEDAMQLDVAGGFKTEDEAGYLAQVFNAGPLPLPLKVVSTQITSE